MSRPLPALALLLLVACRSDGDKPDTDTLGDTGPQLTDADGDGWPEGEDCDDSDASVNPDAEERCDGLDNDCDGEVDEQAVDAPTWYADADQDGWGDPDTSQASCEQPGGWVEDDRDCDDGDDRVHPEAAERCNGADDDCDGEVDEDVLETWYADADGDGFGDPLTTTDSCDPGEGWIADSADCDDDDAAVHPEASETCNGIDDDCDERIDDEDDPVAGTSRWYQDADGDGWGDEDSAVERCEQPSGTSATPGDCDDGDAAVHPSAFETCNGIDDDCDGNVDERDATDAATWYQDADGDGYGDAGATTLACDEPSGFVADSTDCDDADAAIHPAADERCDGFDNDCDGSTDEDDAIDAPSWWADGDGDGYGDAGRARAACDQPSGFVADSTDCDDADAAIHPAADERCDGIDDDCDGSTDEDDAIDAPTWYRDGDSDGFGDADISARACSAPSGFVSDASDCDDGDDDIRPDADELCDGADNDCDGSTDEDDAVDASSFYADADADGYGDAATATVACSAPSGFVSDDSDCEDGDGAINPGASEICNELDDDCDGRIDDDDPDLSGGITWYIDYDADGYGATAYTTEACEAPAGYVGDTSDCDDTDGAVHPGAGEVCNGVDDDCDGSTDDDDDSVSGTSSFYADADADGYGDPASSAEACSAPSGHVADDSDCDDSDGGVHPGAEEHCDGLDEDCDGAVDEEAVDGSTWYADTDGDGYGDPSTSASACDQPSGYVADDSDCDDTDPGDLDSDGLQDCEDDDIDGDGLRNAWDADSYDDSIIRGPTAGLGGDGDWVESSGGVVIFIEGLQLLQSGATAGDTQLEIDGAELLASGDELLIWSVQGVDAGTHQFVFASAIDGDMVTIEPALFDDYDAGSEILVQRVPHWEEVTLDDPVSAVSWSDAGFAPVVFRATGTVLIHGEIDVSGGGFAGGEGVYGNGYDPYQGESYNGLGAAGVASANAGGGGAYPRRGDNADSGAGGGYGSAGSAGTNYGGSAVTSGGASYGDAELTGWFLGSGGGGGSPDTEGDGACSSEYSGDGGAGGSLVAIFAGVAIEVHGGIYADGSDGDDAISGPCQGEVGGGGGGSGGTIQLAAPSISITGSVSALGGLGGSSASANAGTPYGAAWGGDGGDGRVRLDYDSLSGTTSPSAGWEAAYED